MLFDYLKKNNVSLQVHYIPIHLQPYYKKNFGYRLKNFPNAEKFYEQEVSLPIFYSLKDKDITKIIKFIKSFARLFFSVDFRIPANSILK